MSAKPLRWKREYAGSYVSTEGGYRISDNGGGVWVVRRQGTRLASALRLTEAKVFVNNLEGRVTREQTQ